MAITDARRKLLQQASTRLRALAALERSRSTASECRRRSVASRNAAEHDKQAAALQAELDGGGEA